MIGRNAETWPELGNQVDQVELAAVVALAIVGGDAIGRHPIAPIDHALQYARIRHYGMMARTV